MEVAVDAGLTADQLICLLVDMYPGLRARTVPSGVPPTLQLTSNGRQLNALDSDSREKVVLLSLINEELHGKSSIRERFRTSVTPALYQYNSVSFVRGDGSRLWDDRGREYLDFTAGIGVLCLGHGCPTVTRAIEQQLRSLTHLCAHVGFYETYVELIERVKGLLPTPLSSGKGILMNSGSEATEAALKLARMVTGKSTVLAFHGGFHGRPMGALAATGSNSGFRRRLSGLLAGTVHAPYPVESPSGPGEMSVAGVLAHIWQVFDNVLPPGDLAAILVEPVQGEGGIHVAPPGFLAALRQLCDQTGALLILDEIQTGLGRTGTMFGFEHDHVVPDVLLLAKALGGGLPLGCVIARADLMDAWPRGAHGSTFGGNPVACAAGCAVLDRLASDDLPRRAGVLGDLALGQLRQAQTAIPLIRFVRGRGLLIGVEVDRPVSEVLPRIADAGVICSSSGRGSVVRISPALNIREEDLRTGVDRVTQVLSQI